MVIKDIDVANLKKVADDVKPDSRKRIVLQKVQIPEGIRYHIYINSIGQIVLDPHVTIPASEAWLFKDKDTLALLDKSMNESSNGQVIKRGSFAKYAKNEA